MDEVKEKKVQHKAVEAGNKAVAGRNERCREDKPSAEQGGGQQVSSHAPVNTGGTFRAPVNGCTIFEPTDRLIVPAGSRTQRRFGSRRYNGGARESDLGAAGETGKVKTCPVGETGRSVSRTSGGED